MIIKGPPTSSEEYQLIFQWLDERFHYSIGAMAFLNQTQATNTEWQLLRLYDSRNAKQLLGVAVIVAGGTCFWVPSEASSGSLLCRSILELQPRRIVTTAIGRDLLHAENKQKDVFYENMINGSWFVHANFLKLKVAWLNSRTLPVLRNINFNTILSAP